MATRQVEDADRPDVAAFIQEHWGSSFVMSRGRRWRPHEQEGFVDRQSGRIVGLVTFRCDEDGMEVLTINSTLAGHGLGSTLMLAVIDLARRRQIGRIWLTTTNDNLRTVGFYQRLGFRLIAVNRGAVDEARKVKPQIPEIGENGIPIHDELVMELRLEPSAIT